MDTTENQCCVFLGIKVKPGPVERYKIENFNLDNTVDNLKREAERKANIPSASLELIHHGKILKTNDTLQSCGIKSGEMVHVMKKKEPTPTREPVAFSYAEMMALNASLRSLGCTPNAPGWTRAMQLLNDESVMAELLACVPALRGSCVALSALHEPELLLELGAGAPPALLAALRHLVQRARDRTAPPPADDGPTSGFAYSLEALSEDEEADEEGGEATASSSERRGGSEGLLRLLRAAGEPGDPAEPAPGTPRAVITPEMFNAAITDALNLTRAMAGAAPADHAAASSSGGAGGAGGGAAEGAGGGEQYPAQLRRMRELGLLDDALNMRALLICSGDVNAAINLVFSGVIGGDVQYN